jgi:hypothetical protein
MYEIPIVICICRPVGPDVISPVLGGLMHRRWLWLQREILTWQGPGSVIAAATTLPGIGHSAYASHNDYSLPAKRSAIPKVVRANAAVQAKSV